MSPLNVEGRNPDLTLRRVQLRLYKSCSHGTKAPQAAQACPSPDRITGWWRKPKVTVQQRPSKYIAGAGSHTIRHRHSGLCQVHVNHAQRLKEPLLF